MKRHTELYSVWFRFWIPMGGISRIMSASLINLTYNHFAYKVHIYFTVELQWYTIRHLCDQIRLEKKRNVI